MTESKNAIVTYMRAPEVMARFNEILGSRVGQAYVQSVLIAVAGSPDLMACTPASIYRSALRAASLGLSCDPALKQAWLVPYNRKVKAPDGSEKWVKEAQFQPHYKGLYTLAMRTGKYWQINVAPIYEGQRVMENPMTGMHAVSDGMAPAGLTIALAQPDAYNAAYSNDVTVRRRKDQKIIGWIGYFKTKKGFEKSVYMSCVEIDDHARQYVKEYEKNPNWNNADKRPVMEMKTVLRQLLSWADMSGTEAAQLNEALQAEEESINGEVSEAAPANGGMPYDAAKQVTVGKGKQEKFVGELDAETLNKIVESDKTTPEQKEAARVILAQDFGFHESEAPKRATEEIAKEMGF